MILKCVKTKEDIENEWRFVGQGYFATVYGHNSHPNVVIRVSSCHDQWHQYSEFSRISKSVHALKIFETKKISESMKAAVIEKLEPLSISERRVIEKHTHYDPHSFIVSRLLPVSMKEYIKELHQSLSTLGCCYDLHPGNIMKRKDGTLVVTDPIA